MTRHELAQEFALTDDAAAELCARLGISTGSPDDVFADVDAESFRRAARAELALGPTAEPPPGEDVAAGWAAPDPTGAWAPSTNGHGDHQSGHGDHPSDRGPAHRANAGPGAGGPASWASQADVDRLDAARRRASSYTTSGYLLLGAGLVVTMVTLAFAGGGFLFVSFACVFVGFRRLRAGRMMRAQIRDAEEGPGPGAR